MKWESKVESGSVMIDGYNKPQNSSGFVSSLGVKVPAKVIWHKCNSAQQMISAISSVDNGVGGLEYDVVATSDNVPVLFHDKIVEINGKYVEISSLSLRELQGYYPKIQTLASALKKINNINFPESFQFHLEIKPGNLDFVPEVIKILEHFPRIDKQTIIRSFKAGVIAKVNEDFYTREDRSVRKVCLLLGGLAESEVKVSYRTNADETTIAKVGGFYDLPEASEIKRMCGVENPFAVSIHHDMLTPDFVSSMQCAGIKVAVYTVNDIKELKGIAVDEVVSDEPIVIASDLSKEVGASMVA